MGWFKKKEGSVKNKKNVFNEIPSLPELPKLPEIGNMKQKEEKIPQLPSFPNSSLGKKFSQDSIKEAVIGGKEVMEDLDMEDIRPRIKDIRTMPNPPRKEIRTDYKRERMTMPHSQLREVKQEPVFIRIDKFEESLKLFEDIRSQVAEMEKILQQTKTLKEEEEKEIASWEQDMQTIKGQIEKIDRDIFSKIE
jgi:hypothetical protein